MLHVGEKVNPLMTKLFQKSKTIAKLLKNKVKCQGHLKVNAIIVNDAGRQPAHRTPGRFRQSVNRNFLRKIQLKRYTCVKDIPVRFEVIDE